MDTLFFLFSHFFFSFFDKTLLHTEKRRKNASFRYFGHGEPLSRDIGSQFSSKYRSGKNHRREGYEMLKRRASGEARVKHVMLMKGTCPVTRKEFGVQGPLPKR